MKNEICSLCVGKNDFSVFEHEVEQQEVKTGTKATIQQFFNMCI